MFDPRARKEGPVKLPAVHVAKKTKRGMPAFDVPVLGAPSRPKTGAREVARRLRQKEKLNG